MTNRQLTLSQLNEQIKDTIYQAFPETVWVVAEVSELKVNRSGHCYLDLIETVDNNTVARMRAMIWSYTFRMLKPYFETSTNTEFTDGIKVLLQVVVEFHPVYGLSLNIKDIDPAYTLGDMALKRQEVIDRLKKEGVFEMNKELTLPLVPQRIAIISSETAAGYQDFMKQLHDSNHFAFHIQLFEAYMQGNDASSSIIQSLEKIFLQEDQFDVVVMIRGGGAVADLSCFDDYELAFNITQFPLPIITGIGHEKDVSIADYVAHTNMKTPTAVADFLLKGIEAFDERLNDAFNRLENLSADIISTESEKLRDFAALAYRETMKFLTEREREHTKLLHQSKHEVNFYINEENRKLSAYNALFDKYALLKISKHNNQLQRLEKATERVSKTRLKNVGDEIEQLNKRMLKSNNQFLTHKEEGLQLYENSIRLLNPKNILKRGFSVTTINGKVVKSIDDVNKNDKIKTYINEGSLMSTINKKIKNGEKSSS